MTAGLGVIELVVDGEQVWHAEGTFPSIEAFVSGTALVGAGVQPMVGALVEDPKAAQWRWLTWWDDDLISATTWGIAAMPAFVRDAYYDPELAKALGGTLIISGDSPDDANSCAVTFVGPTHPMLAKVTEMAGHLAAGLCSCGQDHSAPTVADIAERRGGYL